MAKKAIFGLVVAFIVLALAEGLLRLRYSVDELLFAWERPAGLISTSEGGFVVTRPNMTDQRADGPYPWRIQTNDMGFREDHTIPRERSPNTTRILALGDSWIFGFSVDHGATIGDVVEAQLSAKKGHPVEVINGGVFGSGAFDMLKRYYELVGAYAPDGILIGQPHNAARSREAGAERTRWYQGLRDRPTSTLRMHLLFRRWLAPYRSGTYASLPQGQSREPDFQDIRTMAKDARERGIKMYFLELPDRLNGSPGGYRGSPDWRAAIQDEGVILGGHTFEERACWGFIDLGHPSAAGAYVLGTLAAEMIATGQSVGIRSEPACSANDAAGPGKPGWPWDKE